jgi:hypothetical protein
MYNRRRGGDEPNPETEQRLVLPPSVRQFMAQIDRDTIEKYHSTLTT